MNALDPWIEKLEAYLPENCRTSHLVASGIYNSIQSAAYARYNCISPPYVKIGGKILYPKAGVIKWLRENYHEGNDKKIEAKPSVSERCTMVSCCGSKDLR